MALLPVALFLAASIFLPDSARGQSNPARPSAENAISSP